MILDIGIYLPDLILESDLCWYSSWFFDPHWVLSLKFWVGAHKPKIMKLLIYLVNFTKPQLGNPEHFSTIK